MRESVRGGAWVMAWPCRGPVPRNDNKARCEVFSRELIEVNVLTKSLHTAPVGYCLQVT